MSWVRPGADAGWSKFWRAICPSAWNSTRGSSSHSLPVTPPWTRVSVSELAASLRFPLQPVLAELRGVAGRVGGVVAGRHPGGGMGAERVDVGLGVALDLHREEHEFPAIPRVVIAGDHAADVAAEPEPL